MEIIQLHWTAWDVCSRQDYDRASGVHEFLFVFFIYFLHGVSLNLFIMLSP